MTELVSVFGDPNTHTDGELLADNNSDKLFIEGKKVNLIGSNALVDGLGHSGAADAAATGTDKFYVSGIKVHRNNDSRVCGALTVVTGQTKVFSG